MADNNSKGYIEHLNTGNMSDATTAFSSGIKEYNSIKTDVENATSALFSCWKGKGKTQFEKDYATIYRQLEDIEDILYELYDALVDAQAAYISTDQELGKNLTL
jgi:WXG100 family type VII secretion target